MVRDGAAVIGGNLISVAIDMTDRHARLRSVAAEALRCVRDGPGSQSKEQTHDRKKGQPPTHGRTGYHHGEALSSSTCLIRAGGGEGVLTAQDAIDAMTRVNIIVRGSGLTIPAAIDMQKRIGIDRKFAHLPALRDQWHVHGRNQERRTDAAVRKGHLWRGQRFPPAGMPLREDAVRARALFVEKHKLLPGAKAGLTSGPCSASRPPCSTTCRNSTVCLPPSTPNATFSPIVRSPVRRRAG